MMDRSDDRQLLGLQRQLGKMLTNDDSGRGGLDRFKITPNLAGSIWLGVPRLVVAHSAPAVQDDAAFRTSCSRCCGEVTKTEKTGHGHAACSQSRLKKTSAAHMMTEGKR